MEQLMNELLALLRGSGVYTIAAMPEAPMPRLKGPAAALCLTAGTVAPAAMCHYLGKLENGSQQEDLYGRLLRASFTVQVFSPASGGGPGNAAAVAKILDVLLAEHTVKLTECMVGECRYEAKYDCYVCPVELKVSRLCYLTASDDGVSFEDFILEGVYQ